MTRKCKRCGHEWFPRQEEPPKTCPRCNSRSWDKDTIKNDYKFRDIWIGQAVVLPWFTKNGEPDYVANNRRNSALYTYMSRTGKKFSMRGAARGLEIKRIA